MGSLDGIESSSRAGEGIQEGGVDTGDGTDAGTAGDGEGGDEGEGRDDRCCSTAETMNSTAWSSLHNAS